MRNSRSVSTATMFAHDSLGCKCVPDQVGIKPIIFKMENIQSVLHWRHHRTPQCSFLVLLGGG